jgi:hypothetical protein
VPTLYRGETDVVERLSVAGFRESSQLAIAALYVDAVADVRALVTAAPTVRGGGWLYSC